MVILPIQQLGVRVDHNPLIYCSSMITPVSVKRHYVKLCPQGAGEGEAGGAGVKNVTSHRLGEENKRGYRW